MQDCIMHLVMLAVFVLVVSVVHRCYVDVGALDRAIVCHSKLVAAYVGWSLFNETSKHLHLEQLVFARFLRPYKWLL